MWKAFCEYLKEKVTNYKGVNVKGLGTFTFEVSTSLPRLGIDLLPCDVQNDLKITPEQGKENVNMFSNIAGINAWCSITEDPNPKDYCWRISIRSKEKDISGVVR